MREELKRPPGNIRRPPGSKSLGFEKSPVRPGCRRFALASDRGESKLLFLRRNKQVVAVRTHSSGFRRGRRRARPNWSIAGERSLIHSNRTAAGGQTEFPYGCGRVALRAWEES